MGSRAGAGAGQGQSSSSAIEDGARKLAQDSSWRVPIPDMAAGGLLWADETKMQMVVRDGAFADAVRLHVQLK